MLTIRRADDRGTTDFDWLYSRHTFSFGDYVDANHHNFRALRVINDDIIAGGGGFPTHPHRDMEILTYVMRGRLEHRDSMGNGTVIGPGEWQKMSAGTGVRHSEFNPSPTEAVHLLQIWVMPERKGLQPEYDQKLFTDADKAGQWRTIASRDGRGGSIRVHQDLVLSARTLKAGESASYDITPGRAVWAHVTKGALELNQEQLGEGDAAAVNENRVTVRATQDGEVLLFDLG
ncbi:pirin family protein [Limnoglobus roseus]|uniref:Pirin family protein n=1 Tax=Limnoglobus roseus TaxID=2598579 RepID=A0A5C1AP85_9BACT|nr:pirin family protein [Limnoglobus roseus]QEL19967.1 pirin family protein [Limnoglobus roseus]